MMAAEHRDHDQAIDAAEYVLGTLESKAKSRFETRLMHDESARSARDYWEHRLGALGLAPAPVEPPAAVWDGLAERIAIGRRGADRDRNTSDRATPAVTPAPAANDSWFWRGATIAVSVVALVLGGLLFERAAVDTVDTAGPPIAQEPSHAFTSVVYDDETNTGWLMTADREVSEMRVFSNRNYSIPEGKMLTAWLQPEEGQPVLLGEWPHAAGAHVMSIPEAVDRRITGETRLTVSLSDRGVAADDNGETAMGRIMWSAPIVATAS